MIGAPPPGQPAPSLQPPMGAPGNAPMGGPPSPPPGPTMKEPTQLVQPTVEFPAPMHFLEEIVKGAVEEYYRMKQIYLEWGRIGNRPAFTVALTPLEKYQRWADPVLRQRYLLSLGPKKASMWAAEMSQLEEQARGMVNGRQ